jgi:hypothetical protein
VHEAYLRQIPLSAMFIVLGIALPQIFHLFGLGSAFLPMFLPLIVGSMFLNWPFALLMALFCPIISCLLTGMPPIAPPVLPVMMIELVIISLLVSILRQRSNLSVLIILILTVLIDRLTLFVIVSVIAPFFSISQPLFNLTIVMTGIPGIIMQFIIVPVSVNLIEKKYPSWKPEKQGKQV